MVTLVIEDGSVVSGANSYVTAAEFRTFCENRDIAIVSTYGDESQLLLKAMDFLEQQDFIGIKSNSDQPLQFPRSDLWIDGYAVDADAIPQLLKDAQITIAISIMAGNDPLGNVDRTIKKERIDVLEIEYADQSAPTVIIRSIHNVLKKLVGGSNAGSGGNTFAVFRM